MFRSAPFRHRCARSTARFAFLPSPLETRGQNRTVGKANAKKEGDIVFQLHIYRVTNRRSVLWYHRTAAPTGSPATATGGSNEGDSCRLLPFLHLSLFLILSPSRRFLRFSARLFFPGRNICGNTVDDRTMPRNKQVNYFLLSRRIGWWRRFVNHRVLSDYLAHRSLF